MKRKLNPILPQKERLARNERLTRNLEYLSSYCSPRGLLEDADAPRDVFVLSVLRGISGSYWLGYWPSPELLVEIETDVVVLAQRERKSEIFPLWKAFEQLDRRAKKLRLKSSINDLVRRARRLLSDESKLNNVVKLAIAGKAQDIVLYCDMLKDSLRDPQKFAELLQAHDEIMRQRVMADPLVYWTHYIEHPMSKDLGSLAEFLQTPGEFEARRQRENRLENTRKRVQLFRKKTVKKALRQPNEVHERKAP